MPNGSIARAKHRKKAGKAEQPDQEAAQNASGRGSAALVMSEGGQHRSEDRVGREHPAELGPEQRRDSGEPEDERRRDRHARRQIPGRRLR